MRVVGDFLDLAIGWEDRTSHGTFLSGRLIDTVRNRLHPESWARLSTEMSKPPERRSKMSSDELCELIRAERQRDEHVEITRDRSFWRPDPGLVQIGGLTILSESCGASATMALTAADCAGVRDWLRHGEADHPLLLSLIRATRTAVARSGFERMQLERSDRGPVMVGHACVTWSDGDVRLWTDPFLRPKRLRYPARQQPISPLDTCEPQHVLLITHAHPDHFDPGSLLLFPRDSIIVVPRVAAESPLTLDLALRCRQLGFEDVRTPISGDRIAVGRFTVAALPFFGEQPLGFYADAPNDDRNVGSTYYVKGPGGLSALFLADAGADPGGSTMRLARELRRTIGRVDFVFGNHRRWRIFPPQYLTSSVPQYLCYVPDDELGVPQLLMLNPEELAEIGAVLQARGVVPYAMGNAPWFAEIGLGSESETAGASPFEARPHELADLDGPDVLLQSSAIPRVLAPGDGIDEQGPWRLSGREPIDPSGFINPARVSPARAMAIGGPLGAELVRDLLELTRIEPSAYLAASPDFVELVTDDGTSPEYLWHLATRLIGEPAWIARSATPLVAGVFETDPTWMRAFDQWWRRVNQALRDEDQTGATLRALVQPLRAALPSDAIEAVARALLKIEFSVSACAETDNEVWPVSSIVLPHDADMVVQRHGDVMVTRALFLVKLVHGAALLLRATDRFGWPNERSFFQELLGDGLAVNYNA
jgi:L-ascorbate metabolism protein UlaG (beta-lactamase superfamily)